VDRIALYRDLIGLRRAHVALQTGGFRWVHVGADAVVFVRESVDEAILVVASDGELDVEVRSPSVVRADLAVPLFGEATISVAEDGTVLLSARGPVFAVWALPGVVAPAVADGAPVVTHRASAVPAYAASAAPHASGS
jgi:alpha-glucosidase